MAEKNGLRAQLAAAEKERDHYRETIRQITQWNDNKFPSLTQILQRKDEG